MAVKNYIRLLVFLLPIILTACGEALSQESSTPPSSPSVVYESVIEVHWSSGIQTHHQLYGPRPGIGEAFLPPAEWEVPLTGATANSKTFRFDFPTQRANLAVWKLVWVPGVAKARLTSHDTTEPVREVVTEMPSLHPDRDPFIPTTDKIDITHAINEMIDSGHTVIIRWEVSGNP